MTNLKTIQREIGEWSRRNFGETTLVYDVAPLLGMAEEVGEICHAVLKASQGIRGSPELHREAIVDGVADLIIFTLDFCDRNGIDAWEALSRTWEKVKQRDWAKNPFNGLDESRSS